MIKNFNREQYLRFLEENLRSAKKKFEGASSEKERTELEKTAEFLKEELMFSSK